MIKTIEVAAGLVFRGGRLLITQRQAHEHLGGLWEFPGGKREPGETLPECLQRELREELAIEVDVLELVECIHHAYPEKQVELSFFRCAWRQHEPRTIGCQAFRWIESSGLDLFEFPPADARLLQRLREQAQLWR